MQLKDNLYTILKREGEMPLVDYSLMLHPSCFIYQAHFPGEPITPGVCIVQIGKELLENLLQRPMTLSKVKNVKFLSILTPKEGQLVRFAITKLTQEDEVKAQMIVSTQGEVKAKLSLILREG